MSDQTIADPPITPGSEPYWDATRERRLLYQWCDACAVWVHYPRPRCPRCFGTELSWREPAPDHRLYSWALHRAVGDNPPRMVVLVDVDDGLRVLADLIDTEGDGFAGIAVDQAVQVVWTPLADGRFLPDFQLAPASIPEEHS